MLTEQQREFRTRISELAKKIGAQHGVDWRLITAAAILESGWGDSELAQNAKNFFGIKATASTPKSEVYLVRGERFRRYPSEEDSFRSYAVAYEQVESLRRSARRGAPNVCRCHGPCLLPAGRRVRQQNHEPDRKH